VALRGSSVVILLGIAVACSRRTGPPSLGSSPQAKPDGTIAGDGGVLESEGARITIIAGAVRTPRVYSVKRVTGAALADWPRGTAAGYVFEPAGEHFRVPATVELPSEGVGGEVMCQPLSGERMTVPFDPALGSHGYRFHVAELPRRCAVYTAERAAILQSARERQGEVIADLNERHKWTVQSELCNPHMLVRANAGKALREPPGIGGCPAGMAPIVGRPACIDRWEAHVVEVLEDGSGHSWSPFFNPAGLKVRAKSAPGAVPQGYISQNQAAQACTEAGKRLCADDEWVAACRGSKNSQYPYGKDEKLGTCNDRRDQHPAVEYLESTDAFAKLEHPCINQVPNSVLLTGAKTECTTPEGVFDMVGNLHEWTADRNGTFRGGYYVETKLNGRGCDYVTTRHNTAYWDYSIGFRCCSDQRKP
jgi:hypothetical protein